MRAITTHVPGQRIYRGVRWHDAQSGAPLGHAVVIERVDLLTGRVYIRQASLLGGMKKGDSMPGLLPPTTLEDPAHGVWSLSLADLGKNLMTAIR